MRKSAIAFIILSCILQTGWGNVVLPSPAHWIHNFDEALKLSVQNQKPILLVFSGSDWCRPCMLLDQAVFNDPTFLKYAEANLILLKIDFPRKKKNLLPQQQMQHNEAIAQCYNPDGKFPLLLLIDSKGKEVAAFQDHYTNAHIFVGALQQTITNHQGWKDE